MTRIFDALRKARPEREVLPAPPTPFAPPLHGVPAAPAPAHRPAPPLPGVVVLPVSVRLPEAALREMAALQLSVESALGERRPRVVAFVASQSGEGTTTVATQFAHALAREPEVRVLIVDAHARRSGLMAQLDQQMRVQAASSAPRSRTGRVSVLPLTEEARAAGAMAPSALRALVEAAAADYDWVVVDGPPVLDAPEAPALAALADGVVLVVQAGRTKRPVLGRAVELLRKAGGRVLGTVLNRRRLEIPGFIYRRI